VGAADVCVLITGESGTGKEIVARAVHQKSGRAAQAFVAVNCAGLPENLIESELFGHVRGAFTGALTDRAGAFRLAHRGTLFLDEIGDLSPKGQGDLLRVLEDGTFRPIGSTRQEHTDVRIIAATNRDLVAAVRDGRFRADLFYRINIVELKLPRLQERPEDIPQLAESFLAHFCARHRRRPKRLSPAAMQALQRAAWPGNVRQLRNVIERLVVIVHGATIEVTDLPPELTEANGQRMLFAVRPGMKLAEVEGELIRLTLTQVTANREAAARTLGISRRALQYKLKALGLGAAEPDGGTSG
jgi:DNA-binding NtrC family response regulator